MTRLPGHRVRLMTELLEDRITPAVTFTQSFNDPNIGYFPNAIAAGDLANNGITDVAIGNNQDGVEILTNDGAGNFTQSSIVNPGFAVDELKLVDLTGNGKLDLVGVGNFSQKLFVALGNGDGTFQTPIVTNIGQNIQSLDVGDMNGDGLPDLVLGIGGGMAVFMNNGSSDIFGAPTYYHFSNQSGLADGSVLIGRFNNSGLPDVAVADSSGQGIEIYPNLGNGAFGAPTRYDNPIPNGSGSLVAGDFTNDGHLDLVVNYEGTRKVGLLVGNGDGTFQVSKVTDINTGTMNLPGPMAVGDFDASGNLDLVYATTGSVMILPGNGKGGFGTPVTAQGCYDASGVVVADLTGDGEPDIGCVNQLEPGIFDIGEDTSVSPNWAVASFGVTAASPVVAGKPVKLTVTATTVAGQVMTDFTGRIELTDSVGLPVSTSTVLFSSGDHGVAQITETFDTAGPQVFTVESDAKQSATGSFDLTVTPGAVGASSSSVSLAAPTDVSETGDDVTITVKDAFGNPISGLSSSNFSFRLQGGKSTGTFGAVTPTSTAGTYSATFTGALAGTADNLVVSVNGVTLAAEPKVQVEPNVVSGSASSVGVSSGVVTSGGTATVTIKLKDALGNAISGLTDDDFVVGLRAGRVPARSGP
jgi:hypothetical protein